MYDDYDYSDYEYLDITATLKIYFGFALKEFISQLGVDITVEELSKFLANKLKDNSDKRFYLDDNSLFFEGDYDITISDFDIYRASPKDKGFEFVIDCVYDVLDKLGYDGLCYTVKDGKIYFSTEKNDDNYYFFEELFGEEDLIKRLVIDIDSEESPDDIIKDYISEKNV